MFFIVFGMDCKKKTIGIFVRINTKFGVGGLFKTQYFSPSVHQHAPFTKQRVSPTARRATDCISIDIA